MAIPPHHQDQRLATSVIAEARMATTETAAVVERAKRSANAKIMTK